MSKEMRRDVTIVLGTYLAIDWYGRQLLRARPSLFKPADVPAIFAAHTQRPATPVVRMTPERGGCDSGLHRAADGAQIFRAGDVTGRVEPGILTRDEILVLRIITDSFPDRAIYFAPGSSYPARLGLARYIVREGLLEKLGTDSASNGALDVPTSALLWKQYRAPASIARRGDWIDRASISVPVNYALLGATLSNALAQRGDSADSNRIALETSAVIGAARLEELFGSREAR